MFKKNSDVHTLIVEQIKDVEKCLVKFESFMEAATTPETVPETLVTLVEGVKDAENVADRSLRAIIDSLSDGAYLPSTREDLISIATSCDKEVGMGAWTPKMPELFREATGLDIFDVIPELIWNLPDNEVSKKRYLYHDFVTELFVKSFADKIGKWCDENDIMLTGHVQAEDFLESQTK